MSLLSVLLRVKIESVPHLEELKQLAAQNEYQETGAKNGYFFIRLVINAEETSIIKNSIHRNT